MSVKRVYLEDDDIVYVRLQGVIWVTSGLISPFKIQKSGVDALTTIYTEVSPEKPLVINCARVTEIGGKKAFDQFLTDIVGGQRQIILVFNKETIVLKEHLIEILERLHVPRSVDQFTISVGSSSFETKLIQEKIGTLEMTKVKSAVKLCFEEHKEGDERLVSTSIMASGEFNTAKIISNPDQFLWVSMILADKVGFLRTKIEKKNEEEGIDYEKLKLLSVSLRGSPFASAVALLTNTGYDTIDHLGPKHKLFDIEVLDKIEKDVLYIFVGDFIAGGTEVKIAQTYTNLLGCRLEHAVAIGALLDSEVFEKQFEQHCLVHLTEPGVQPNAKYSLKLPNFDG